MFNGPKTNASEVAEILRHGWGHLFLGPITTNEIVAGRLSDEPLWKVGGDDRECALRRWPQSGLAAARRAHLFAQAMDSDCPAAPRPIAPLQPSSGDVLADGFGHVWELCDWLRGESNFAAKPSEAKLANMGRALAVVHQCASRIQTPEASKKSSIATHTQKLRQLEDEINAGLFASVNAQIFASSKASLEQALHRGVEIALEKLACLEAAAFRTQWCWGDAWHNNFLFDGEEVVGIVDFATVRIDSPAADVARLLGSVTQRHPEWLSGGLNAYEELRPLTNGERRAIAALSSSGTVLSLANWLRWLHLEKRVFRDPQAAQARLAHFVYRFETLASGA